MSRYVIVMDAYSDTSPNPSDASQTAARLSKTADMLPRHVSYVQYKLLRTSHSPRAAVMLSEHDDGTWDVFGTIPAATLCCHPCDAQLIAC